MRRIVFLALIIKLFFNLPVVGFDHSEDPVLLTINGRTITISEFEYVYTKNNLNPQVMDPKSIDEYLDLFINFNLKVHQAMELGLDTKADFKDELQGYRNQLAQPYLTDQEVSEKLLEEAWERMQYDVRASHILINLEKHANPKDTLQAWEQLMDIRERIMEGENFHEMAVEYSDDPSAKGMPATANRPAQPGNSGDLGYFSVLDMVYPFENAVYNMDIGELSMPVRTDFGYHLIKLTDRLPAMGRARVAHIMVQFPPDASQEQQEKAQDKIKEIYARLIDGEEFAALAERFSDDKASGRRGGELPAFTSNRMVPEFIAAINQLDQENSYSEPVRSQYGWHIIHLLEKQLPDQEEAMAELKNKISRDSRAFLSQKVVVNRLKEEYAFSENIENLDLFFEWVDSSVFEGRWNVELTEDFNHELFSFADKTFDQSDFAQYIKDTQTMRSPEPIRSYVTTMYNNFVDKVILDYEESRLPEKYPEFKQIMKEYHDGILLFELTDQKVWSKAMEDTAGLNAFFRENIDEYMWEDRFDVVLYTFNDEAAARSGRREIRRASRRDETHEELMEKFNEDSQLEVSAEKGIFEISEKPLLTEIPKRNGVSRVLSHNGYFVVARVTDFMESQPKKLNEVRGLVIADYQNHLEKKWVAELREQYNYNVNRESLQYLNFNE